MPLYLMYSFPVILIYGVVTSILSDKIGELLSKKGKYPKVEWIVSGIFHIMFGFILLYISLLAAILFFIVDRILKKYNKRFHWKQAVKSLAIPVGLWIIFMGKYWL